MIPFLTSNYDNLKVIYTWNYMSPPPSEVKTRENMRANPSGLTGLRLACDTSPALTTSWVLLWLFPSQKLWPYQWSNEQIMTLFGSLLYFAMILATLLVWFVTYSSRPTFSFLMGCVAQVAIAGIPTLVGAVHCYSLADRAPIDLICGCPALKWVARARLLLVRLPQ